MDELQFNKRNIYGDFKSGKQYDYWACSLYEKRKILLKSLVDSQNSRTFAAI